MFEISLKEEKEALNHLLSINREIVFADRIMCALHPGLYAFSVIEHEDIKLDEPVICECSDLRDIIKSREIDKMTLIPELGKIEVQEPYELKANIKLLDSSSSIDESEKRYESLKEIEKGVEEYLDRNNNTHRIASFTMSNSLFMDMLQRAGDADVMEISTGEKLVFKNHTSGRQVKYSKMSPLPETSVLILEDCQEILGSSFLTKLEGEEVERGRSQITMVDGSFIVVLNKARTIINSKVE